MSKMLALATVLVLLITPAAMAACPSEVPGSTPEAIAANGQRLLCLQRELATATTQRRYDFELKTLENSIQAQQLQRRFDSLPAPTPPLFPPQPPLLRP